MSRVFEVEPLLRPLCAVKLIPVAAIINENELHRLLDPPARDPESQLDPRAER